jgi:maltose/moltooligosaccharide transporter
MGLFNLSVVLPQLASTGVGFVLRDAGDKGVLFVICGGCLAVSAVLWMLVSEKKAVAATPEMAPVH